MQQNFDRSEKQEFLDNYFLLRLQQLLSKINAPGLMNRKDHVENIFESLMDIADEYQAVIVEGEEESYWESIEMWDSELQQRSAVQWANDIQGHQLKS